MRFNFMTTVKLLFYAFYAFGYLGKILEKLSHKFVLLQTCFFKHLAATQLL